MKKDFRNALASLLDFSPYDMFWNSDQISSINLINKINSFTT